ncbi:MAG: hypothetical protein ACE5EY_04365 [Anaerolineae bacterium]
MVIGEVVNHLEEAFQRFRVAVRQVGVLEDVAEQQRNARVFIHLRNRFRIQIQHLKAAHPRRHQFSPTVPGKIAAKESAFPTQLFRFRVHIVHKFVNQGDGNLLHLAFGVGYFAHQNITRRINAPFGSVV